MPAGYSFRHSDSFYSLVAGTGTGQWKVADTRGECPQGTVMTSIGDQISHSDVPYFISGFRIHDGTQGDVFITYLDKTNSKFDRDPIQGRGFAVCIQAPASITTTTPTLTPAIKRLLTKLAL